eukprot:6777251-Pyramimonas_sp.AAC.2
MQRTSNPLKKATTRLRGFWDRYASCNMTGSGCRALSCGSALPTHYGQMRKMLSMICGASPEYSIQACRITQSKRASVSLARWAKGACDSQSGMP